MSNLKELRKLASMDPGYYAVLVDGSTTFIGDKPPATEFMKEYKVLYNTDGTKWSKWTSTGWVSIETQPTDLNQTPTKAAPAKPTAPKTPTPITHPKGTSLADAAYHYFIDGPLAFTWTKIGDNTAKGTGNFTSTNKNWEAAVKNLNLLKPETQQAQATTAPVATTENAKPTEQTATPASTLDAGLVQKVEFILGRAMNYSLDVKSAHSEKAQIAKLVSAIESAKKSGSGLNFLAQMIVASSPNAFQAIAGADLKDLGAATMKDLAVHRNGKYSGDVGVILGKVNAIAANYAKDPTTITGIKTQPSAPAKAASKYPAKIIRLASLRRLRVRSEMEAAIVASAMPGRDRV